MDATDEGINRDEMLLTAYQQTLSCHLLRLLHSSRFCAAEPKPRFWRSFLGDPSAQFSLTELAAIAGTSAATVGREIERSGRADLVRVQGIGRSKLVSADTSSEYFEALARLFLVAFGPRRQVEKLAGLPGVDEVYLFGSWAARYSGDEGPAPAGRRRLSGGEPGSIGCLRSCRATSLLLAQGLRPTSSRGHVAVQRAVIAQFGDAFKPFGKMRRRRHAQEYPNLDSPTATDDDAVEMIRLRSSSRAADE